MKYRKYRTTLLNSLLISSLLLSGCIETGESFIGKESTDDKNNQSSITEELTGLVRTELSNAVEGFLSGQLDIEDVKVDESLINAEEVLMGLLNGEEVDITTLVGPFLESIEPLITSTASDNIEYYNVELKSQYDGDTGTYIVDSGYTIAQDANGDVVFNELSNGELKPGEKIKVRSLLIDTPEMEDKYSNSKEPQPFAVEARDLARKELENADSIVVAYDVGERQDKYGRQLMYIWCDGVLLQETLVEAGLAKVAYITEPNTTYLEVVEAAEADAKANSRGVWSLN